MNEYLIEELSKWGCAIEIGLENHGGDFDLLMLSLRKLANPFRLEDLKTDHPVSIIETLLDESLQCGALPLSDVLEQLKQQWDEDLYEVLTIEMKRLIHIV